MGALIATLQCRFDDARRLVTIAEAATRRPRDRPERAAIALPRLVLLVADGRIADAVDEIRLAQSSLTGWPADPAVTDTLRAWHARLLFAAGAPDQAKQALAAEPLGPLSRSTQARQLLDEGDVQGALDALAAARRTSTTVFPSVTVDIEVVHALALRAASRHAAAASHLEQALDIAAPNNFLRPLLSHGPLIAAALQHHLRRGTKHGAFVEHVLALMRTGEAPLGADTVQLQPLSQRERQILGYLPSTLSNDDIARALYVSVNTIKTHIRAIYRKLGVDNRNDAVRTARQRQLVAPMPTINISLTHPPTVHDSFQETIAGL